MATENTIFGKHIQDWIKQLQAWCINTFGKVKTVNGVSPDSNGNVTISSSNIPDYANGVTVKNATSSSPFTVPEDGVIIGLVYAGEQVHVHPVVNGTTLEHYHFGVSSDHGIYTNNCVIVVGNGDLFYFNTNYSGNVIFYPFR